MDSAEKKPLHSASEQQVSNKVAGTNMSNNSSPRPTNDKDQLHKLHTSQSCDTPKAQYSRKKRKPPLTREYSTCQDDSDSPSNAPSSSRRWPVSLINTLRRVTHLTTLPIRSSLARSRTEETDLGLEDSPMEMYGYADGAVCSIEDSPTYILKCAAAGKASEVARILKKDLTRLHARNKQNQMPIHVAAQKGHVDVLQTMLDFKADIDATGYHGNTPLHVAIIAGQAKMCGFLISSGAKSDIQNDDHLAPIHLAADIGNVDVITEMVKYDIELDLIGEQGQSALHFAAAKDNGEAMRILIDAGSRPCLRNNHGFYPIHIAAQCAAASAMETIIENGIKAGYDRETILAFKDRENNLPLHAAVNGGNIDAVMVCLKSGASVKAQQDDGSTPVHFASAQGNMEMLKLMANMQEDNFVEAVFMLDATKMTPLHRAAFFEHTGVMHFLLDKGANIECKDLKDRTPLLLAASKGAWTTVQLLISKGADVNVKDENNRNFLHLAIRFGGKLEEIGGADFISDIKTLQNDKDDFGCTPVHYASKEGHLLALDDLIKMGAVLNHKNNEKQSPLHFAARYGRLNTCKRLLNSVHGPNIINETDGDGLSALHIAAENGHTKVIQLLLARGAVVNRDHDSNTALHHAAANGWTHSMKILLGVKTNLLDMVNQEEDTALHVAAKSGQTSAVTLLLTMSAGLSRNAEECTFFDYVIQYKNQEVASAIISHERWEEVMKLCSKPYGCTFLGLIQHLPEVAMSVLDRCQTYSGEDQRNKEYHITYNFTYLERPQGHITDSKKNDEPECQPMRALGTMTEFNRVNCLSHPVCVTFLKRKWSKYGCFIYATYLSVYMVFLACLTSFVLSHDAMKHYHRSLGNVSTDYLHGNRADGYHFSICHTVSLWFIVIYGFCNMLKEIGQIFTQKMRYFWEFQNAMEWFLYVTSLLFALPFLMYRSYHWQWESGAIAVFLAWFNCLVFLQRFDFFGIYVVMFLEILRTLIQVVCVFSILFLAFGISFYMLMSSEASKAYSTPSLSILRAFTMMLELDYMASFNGLFVDGVDKTLHFGSLTLILLTIFIFFMPILLMNLLIGLAVGDIESVQRDARLKRLAMQVELHSDMEAKMPHFFLSRVIILQYKEYPNKCKSRLQTVMNLISGNTAMMEASEKLNMTEKHFYEELYKQKVRMREMGGVLDKNYRLLRTIIQKMEIHTEEDAWDEGAEAGNHDDFKDEKSVYRRVNGKSFKDKMYLKKAVVSMWPKGKNF